MPRFDESDNNINRRNNDRLDRSVPDDENYYRGYDISSSDASVRDNQDGYVDINSILNDFSNSGDTLEPPVRYNTREESNEPIRRSAPPKPNKTKKKKKKANKAKVILASIVAIILVIAIAISGGINSILNKITYDEKVENKYVSASDLKSDKDVINILLLGVDARIIKGEEAKNSRSDSMILVSIDKKHECIKAISFLRDSWVYIPCHDGYQRLNASCQYGSYGGVVDTIEYNFGVDINGYVVVNFRVFQTLIDALGGVEIEVTKEEAKEVNNHKVRYGNVTLKAGKQKLTGKQALAYCRIRKIDTDFMRAYRQRTVIQSIIKGLKAEPLKLPSIASGCAEYIETDLTKRELKKIALAGLKCMKTDMVETRVPFDETWKYSNINGASVIELDTDANKEKLIDYIYNKSAEEILAEEKE